MAQIPVPISALTTPILASKVLFLCPKMDNIRLPAYAMNRAATWLGLVAIIAWCSGCVTQMALEDAKTLSHIEFPQPTFSTNDILDAASLARKLQTASDPVSDFLAHSVQPYTRKHVDAYLIGNEGSNQFRIAIAIALDDIIAGPNIYDSSRFEHVNLRPQTKQLLGQGPANGNGRRLNRLLLEDAYPTELARLPDPKVVVDKKGKPHGYALVPFAVMGDVILLPAYVIVSPLAILIGIGLATRGPG